MSTLNHQAQVKISCRDLNQESDFFIQLGFQLQQVFPADNPRMLVLAAYGLVLRIEKGLPVNDLTVILPNNPSQTLQPLFSPSGVAIQFHTESNSQVDFPAQIEPLLTPFDGDESWVTGRAGMLYRDLIPSRLSGAIIASNIKIVDGGPVPDHVHYHSIQFQLIFCTKGWVKVVYEDQGEPFVLNAGDCVTQPPGIRHQVLEASDGLEVVEIGMPAEHMTTLDHHMQLPTGQNLPSRVYQHGSYGGQQFCYHQQAAVSWQALPESGLLRSETSVLTDSGGVAAVNVLKASAPHNASKWLIQHQNRLHFYYVMAGQASYQQAGQENVVINDRDSFVLPPNQCLELSHFSADFQCIECMILG
ncbi:cupin domain-containing protein [Marinicella litoralis]|uniref:Cupin type-2 domain-containing protein n=1 Tax=Marinicella litoralis TaxID=644220 RepID=A0A4R6XBV5_9GAMM|nr:cupin domain-containing protein [Marinicella litoralis]TDR14657.1 hypothetical protein C8D91_2928 [Marinicella litoralis]